MFYFFSFHRKLQLYTRSIIATTGATAATVDIILATRKTYNSYKVKTKVQHIASYKSWNIKNFIIKTTNELNKKNNFSFLIKTEKQAKNPDS